MKPLTLELQGFTGITSGSGKERIHVDLTTIPHDARLVALVGPNGAGKSTIMDNLHPYRVMPSRSSTLGPSGFSYWDNISRPTAKKDLVWEHGGRRYRSALTFKVSGKTRKADCYLFQWNDVLQDWTPAKLDDGTLSDGKTDTYDRCVEGILGVPETFFTSQFSAQNRKAISEYGNGEVKALLASILNLNSYRELSAKASTVGKLLRYQLDALQDELSQARGAEAGIEQVNLELDELAQTAQSCAAAEQAAADRLDDSRKALALLEAKQASQEKVAEEVRFLNDQIARVRQTASSEVEKVTEQSKAESTRIGAELHNARNRSNAAQAGIRAADAELSRRRSIIGTKDDIDAAVTQTPGQRAAVEDLDRRIEQEQGKLSELRSINLQLQEATRKQGELTVSGKSQHDAITRLKDTASLIERVPCAHSDLQHTCPLLAQANEARESIAPQEAVLVDMRSKYRTVFATVESLAQQANGLQSVETELRALNQQRQSALQVLNQLVETASKAEVLKEAELRIPELTEAKRQHEAALAESTETILRCEQQFAEFDATYNAAVAAIQQKADTEIGALNKRLSKLEKPVSEQELATAKQRVLQSKQDLEHAKTVTESMVQKRIALAGKVEAFKAIQEKVADTVAEADRLSDEIAKFKLLEKGLGNDGMIALSIDDAGPEIASLCNALLFDCYGGRFSVRLDTQRSTQAGNVRETFDVAVFDTHRGEEKSLGTMSGGERVWVNECLTRAIALYVGQSSGVSYQTLFTDEADGPLDPERKRQFMEMKRSVLNRGGYEREYFISQTPELWELADHKIDVASL